MAANATTVAPLRMRRAQGAAVVAPAGYRVHARPTVGGQVTVELSQKGRVFSWRGPGPDGVVVFDD